MRKKITSKEYSDAMTSVRLSSHEKVCMERMKTLIKSIDELKKDVFNELRMEELEGFEKEKNDS